MGVILFQFQAAKSYELYFYYQFDIKAQGYM